MAPETSSNANWLRHPARELHAELMARQPLLTGFSWLMLALIVPGLVMLVLDIGGTDARPAHFLGVHAQQLLPLAGLALQQGRLSHAARWLTAVALGYVLLWALLLARALP